MKFRGPKNHAGAPRMPPARSASLPALHIFRWITEVFPEIPGEIKFIGIPQGEGALPRLPLEENIACTRRAAEIAHVGGVPIEAELGAVLGHESGPLPPYEELFASRRGFTSPEEAGRFVRESGADWLSVAVGNIHGAVSAAGKQKEKPHARIDLEHLERLRDAAGIPLVLHGGTGISAAYVQAAFQRGIAKINVATAIRQPYE